MRFRDIPPLIRSRYSINVPLKHTEHTIQEYLDQGLNLCPDFQRGHVWTEQQQTAFVEFLLRDGTSSRVIFFNHPGWMNSWEGNFVIVDGLQRLTAVRQFLANKIPAFHTFYQDYTDAMPSILDLVFSIATLPTKADVLQWYLELNAGGTPHTSEELDRVRTLLAATKNDPASPTLPSKGAS